MVNARLISYKAENEAICITNFTKKEEKIIIWPLEKWKYKITKFSKITKIDEPLTSVLFDHEEPEQWK